MRNVFIVITLFITLIMSGCSSKAPVVEEDIVFPSYPDEPRILYLNTYRGGVVKQDTSFTKALDIFLGTSEEEQSRGKSIIKPYGVGLQNGKVLVADPPQNAVFVIDENTSEANFIGVNSVGSLVTPVAIAFDKDENIYVSDSRQQRVQGYDKNGNFNYVLGSRLDFTHPTGIAIDKELNRLYVVDTKGHHIKAFDIATKKHLFTIGKRGKNDGEFNFPTNVTVDRRNNNIVVCDTQNFRVQVFDKDGNFIRRFGKVGDRPGMFARPKGIAVDSDGNIYVTDSAFNNIQIFNENGDLLMFFGSAGFGKTQFRLITGIYIDENDKMVIADGFSGRVQTFQYISEKWKKEHPEKYNKIKNIGAPEDKDAVAAMTGEK